MLSKITGFLVINLALILPAAILILLVLSRSVRRLLLTLLRLAARPLLLLAVIAMVYDGTRTIAGGSGLVLTSLAEHWSSLAPSSLEAFRAHIMKLGHPLLWDDGLKCVLMLPAWLVIGVLGLFLAYIGRRRHEVKVFVN